MDKLDVGRIEPKTIPYVWSDVLEIVEDYGQKWLATVNIDRVLQQVVIGDKDLWVATDGNTLDMVMFCWWEEYGKVRYYHIEWMGGDGLRKYLKNGLDKIEQYACLNGAVELRFAARAGWEKKLGSYGYGVKSRIMGKNVQVCWRN